MKLFIKVGSILCAFTALAAVALAGDVTGTWHGHLKIDATKIHQPRSAAEKTKMLAHIKQHMAVSPVLTIRPDHTFSIVVPNQSFPGFSGTWSQNGHSMVLTGKTSGKIYGAPQTFTMAANGKSMSMTQHGTTTTFSR